MRVPHAAICLHGGLACQERLRITSGHQLQTGTRFNMCMYIYIFTGMYIYIYIYIYIFISYICAVYNMFYIYVYIYTYHAI